MKAFIETVRAKLLRNAIAIAPGVVAAALECKCSRWLPITYRPVLLSCVQCARTYHLPKST